MLAHLLRLDSRAAAEKHAKMVLVPRKAVTRTPGCVARTILTSGPKVAPWKRAQPANSPYLHSMQIGLGSRETVQFQTATRECKLCEDFWQTLVGMTRWMIVTNSSGHCWKKLCCYTNVPAIQLVE